MANRFVSLGILLLGISFGDPFLGTSYYGYVWAEGEQKAALSVVRVTPEGKEIQSPSEIVVEFNQPMVIPGAAVPKDLPVSISLMSEKGAQPSNIKGSWRWINEKTLVFSINGETPLKNASRYSVVVKAGMKSLDGSVLGKDYSHIFLTMTPLFRWGYVYEWEGPTKPVLIVDFNMTTTKDSVEKHIVLVEDNTAKTQIPVKIESEEFGDDGKVIRNLKAAKRWVARPAQDLRPDTVYTVVALPGIRTNEGELASEKAVENFSRDYTQEKNLKIKTFGEFKLIGITCTLANPEGVIRKPEEGLVSFTKDKPQQATQKCNPRDPVYLEFSAPVQEPTVAKNLIITPDPTNGHPEHLEIFWSKENTGPILQWVSNMNREGELKGYKLRLPHDLKAATDYTFTLKVPGKTHWERFTHKVKGWFVDVPKSELRDVFGRTLNEPLQVTISYGHRDPNYEIPYPQAILEKNSDSEIPMYINNISKASFHYQALTTAGLSVDQALTYDIPDVKDIQFAIPMNFREMLKGKSGLIKGKLTTSPTILKSLPYCEYKNDYTWFPHDPSIDDRDEKVKEPTMIVQVTPYNIQAKIGHFNSLIWVTDLASGQPVPNAKVMLYKGKRDDVLALPKEVLATTQTNENGLAFLPGRDVIDPDQSLIASGWRVKYQMKRKGKSEVPEQLNVRVEKGEDMGLLPLIGDQLYSLDTYKASGHQFWGTVQKKYEHLQSWGFTAQGIYRAGDTVQYKLYLRNQNVNQLVQPPEGTYKLSIIDPLGKVIHEENDVKFNEYGSFSGEVSVPKSAAVGYYQFKLDVFMPDLVQYEDIPQSQDKNAQVEPKVIPNISLTPLQVLISDFTPSPFRVSTDIDKKAVVVDEDVSILEHAELHSGGAYTDAAAKISGLLYPTQFSSSHPLAQGFDFGYGTGDDMNLPRDFMLFQRDGRLNEKGEFLIKETIIRPKMGANQDPFSVFYGKVLVEATVQDDRGRNIASDTNIEYFAGDHLVGVKPQAWVYTAKKEAIFQLIVVDKAGAPIKDPTIDVIIERKEVTAAKVKSAGNAYLSNENVEWIEVVKGALPKTPGEMQSLMFKPDQAGEYRLTAITKDAKNREHRSRISFYVSGGEYVLWGEKNDFYVPLVPEKSEYSIGETAKILIKNPYPGAKALITVERAGVIDSFVQTLEGSTPIIEVPVKADYLPNFYVSVLVFSPRTDSKPLEVGQLDLGKPVLKMGYTSLTVKDHYKELEITATSAKPVYKPRDVVHLDLEAKVKNPGENHENIELAVVVLDESVFDLISAGKSYFDPYPGLYKKEGLDLENFSLLNVLIGRMKFEKKGANPGGGGGFSLKMRNIFKYVSYWNPSVKLDENGKAAIEFEAPDNLTGWRIFVIGSTPTDRFGLGEGNFKVNRDTEIRPVMPNQVREGDQFNASFSIMNRTDKPREIRVSILAKGAVDVSRSKTAYEETLTIEPNKRVSVEMPLYVASVSGSGEDSNIEGKITFEVNAGDQSDQDRLEHVLPVKATRILETVSIFGTSPQEGEPQPISIPKEVYPDVGGLTIDLSPTILSNIGGAVIYMRDYPYTCWEQKLSRVLAAASYKGLELFLGKEAKWPNSEQALRESLGELVNFQAPNGGMTYFRADNDYVDPFLSAFTAMGLGWLKKEGVEINKSADDRLMEYLGQLVRKEFGLDYYDNSMTATVRAMILEAMAQRGVLSLPDLERFKSHVPQMGAYGQACYAQAAMAVEGGQAIAGAVVRRLLGYFSETTTQITFNQGTKDGSPRILSSPLRDACRVIETLIDYSQTPEGKDLVGDKPSRMLKSVQEARKSKQHWENTQENLHCMRAFEKYNRVMNQGKEIEQPNMTVKVEVAGKELPEHVQIKDLRQEMVQMHVPMTNLLEDKTAGKLSQDVLNIGVTKDGTGRLYYTTRLQYASKNPSKEAVSSGIEVKREYTVLRENKWHLLKEGDSLKKGELVQVHLYVMLPGDRTFVVVNDPVPGGFEPIDTKLATSSMMDARHVDQKPAEGTFWHKLTNWVDYRAGRWTFYHQELRHDSVRFYSDYLPMANYHLNYMAQVVADGEFSALPTRAEEMYNPETYGKTAFSHVQVEG